MRVYSKSLNSHALQRVHYALRAYAPAHVKFTDRLDDADVVILHVVGRHNSVTAACEEIKRRGKRYAIIQYCLRSTMQPDTGAWAVVWRHADVVWSYYDLYHLCDEDGTPKWFNFYHAPLGVNSSMFSPMKEGVEAQRQYVICTSGDGYLSESVRECYKAAVERCGLKVIHLGPELKVPNLPCRNHLTDSEVANIYRSCHYVSGLRRTEGFELPAAEGLLCGTRPILFEQPHYRQWYGQWGIFIPETSREKVIDTLEFIFRHYHPVTHGEIVAARKLFDWNRIITEFWERFN